MLLSRVLIIFILFSFNATAQMSKEDIKQVFFDANSGNYKAQNYLGSMYAAGAGVDRNYQHAAEWYRKSSDQGYVDASIRLGYLYKEGRGVQRDYDEARKLFEKVLKKSPNNVDAQVAMGIIYYKGEGVKQDYIKAAEWFKKPAELNNKEAVQWLKSTNRNANGSKLVEELLMNAKSGDINAQYDLGRYYKSYEGKDYKKAFKWFTQASDQNDIRSIVAIGHMFYYGSGVVKNHETAKTWFLRAKKMGSQEVRGYLASIAKEKTRPFNNSFNNAANNHPKTLDIVILFGSLGLVVFYIIFVGWHGYFRKLSIAISPISLYLFVVYYEDWIQKSCSGECNIRIDIFITYPLLLGVVIVGLINLVRIEDKD
ncbi:MAG: sel1 repeat family protein [Methylococcales bacterium]|nr:sel1 repeat family protein [Methylococcales bacterium]